ncbi:MULTISPECIES: FeoA family protein [unclassified Fibrobacter]|uniref:FeoA family protein n=1 Tax=unclassified Fibrobacter TaxID=2634177 RepID=UPI000D6DB4CA|nr:MULTISPECIES: FeoA family protein [unclassified Fibrobacter]PWJ59778.1 ferrous iron transport protein A [Fibrobacter sp. UWR4]PZW68044.1 ferrous iron transport protein A [Fibrobacter sp. UWR1]
MSCNCGCGCDGKSKKWNVEPKFSELKKGDKVEIVGYNDGDARYKSKLLSMGLVRGVTLEVMQIAPLGDPIEVSVLNYRLSLRREEGNVLNLKRV